jgi:hypothetical protein
MASGKRRDNVVPSIEAATSASAGSSVAACEVMPPK